MENITYAASPRLAADEVITDSSAMYFPCVVLREDQLDLIRAIVREELQAVA